jgi:hypothetical protein
MGIVDLEKIFSMQKDLTEYIKNKTPNPTFWDDNQAPFPGYRKFMVAHALVKEVMEYTDELQWKWHKKIENYKVDEINRKEVELPDILHYFVQLCLDEGVTPEQLFSKYEEKWKENHNRQDTGY